MSGGETTLAGLDTDIGEIYRTMGSDEYVPDEQITELVAGYLDKLGGICVPRYGYEIYQLESTNSRSITAEGVTLTTGGVITPMLADADSVALFVATAGREFDEYLHSVKQGGDILGEFVLDAIGSEIAEAAVRLAMRTLEEEQADGIVVSHPYSPGYCGWHIRDQQKLFSLLPPAPCGITLSDSSLMSPLKSVSGVAAIGTNVIKQAYGCALCGRADCYKKRN